MKIEKDQCAIENPVPFLSEDHSTITINDSDNDEPNLVTDQGQDVKPSNEVKRWEIDLSNNVVLKEGRKELQPCPQRRQTARKSVSTNQLGEKGSTQSEDTDLQPKPAGIPGDDGLKTLPKICNFPCPLCEETNRYSANDLKKHYWHFHHGQVPSYPCEMCDFSSPDFQTFTRHLHSHRDTLVKCDICNTERSFTLLDLTKHYTVVHSAYGNFSCERCIFQTRDVGTFVQHMHRHSEEKCEDHLMGHAKRKGFRFNCQYCPYGSMLREQFANHVRAAHRDKLIAKDLRRDYFNTSQHTQAALKLVLKRQAAELSAHGLMKCKSENPSQPSSKCTVVNGGNYANAYRADEMLHAQGWPSASATLSSEQDNATLAGLLKNGVHGPTVLMVKNNKISVPENYSAKFLGFKEVSGKKHIVIKLLPSNKPDLDLSPSKSGNERSFNLHQQSSCMNVKGESTSSAANGLLPLSQVQLGNTCSRSTPFFAAAFPAKAKFEKPSVLSQIAPSALLETKNGPQVPAKSASLSAEHLFASNLESITIPSAAHVLQTTSELCGITSYDKNQNPCMTSEPISSPANGLCVNLERASGDCEKLLFLKKGGSELPTTQQHGDSGSSAPVRKSASLYSIRRPPALSFAPQKVGQVKEKGPSTAADNRLHAPSIFPAKRKSSVVTRSLHDMTVGTCMEADGSLNCKVPTCGKSETDNWAHTTLCGSEAGRVTTMAGIGSMLKAHSNEIITQQLAKEKLGANSQIMRAQNLHEGGRVLIASTPQGLFLPLNFAHQQGLQVVAGDAVPPAANVVPPVGLLNKRPGVVLTFSGGAIGAVANIATVGSQVLGPVAQSNADDPKICKATHSDTTAFIQPSASLINQGTKVSIQGPFIVTKSMTTPVQVAAACPQVAGLTPGTNVCHYGAAQGDLGTASSNLQHAAQEKQPIYALLPDGRRAVLLKYTPSGDGCNPLQANVQNQNVQPMKVEGTKQRYFLKVVKNPTAGVQLAFSPQAALNTSLESLKFDGRKPVENNLQFNVPAVPSSAALPDAVLIPKNSLSGPTPTSLPPPKQLKTLLPKDSSSSAQEVYTSRRSCSVRQQVSWNLRKDNIAKIKCEEAQMEPKSLETESEKRNKRVRQRSKAQIEEPPRKKLSARKCKQRSTAEVEEEYVYTFEPRAPRDGVKTLRLLPFSLNQTVKCPRRNQPVVVLNHPDADYPEIINVMKTIAKFKGHILKVSLSRRTMQALLHQTHATTAEAPERDATARSRRTILPVSPVKERFVLKLTLKKTSKNKYKIVKPCTENTLKATFSCWFCGRIFHNQDEWIGHGQRHLMEATRGWNTLVQ